MTLQFQISLPSTRSCFVVKIVRHFALQEARLFAACAERKPPHTTLHLEMLDGQLSKEAFPKRLLASEPQLSSHALSSAKMLSQSWRIGMPHKFPRVFCGSMWQLGDAFFTKFGSCSTQAKAAVAAHMAVHCRGARRVQLLEKSATIIAFSDNQEEEIELDMMKVVADATASRNIDVFLARWTWLQEMARSMRLWRVHLDIEVPIL